LRLISSILRSRSTSIALLFFPAILSFLLYELSNYAEEVPLSISFSRVWPWALLSKKAEAAYLSLSETF
jgi:hypothetical protein